ncbi:uncharacterized protein SAZU_5844 [Streptomyces azureus]|uniref:Uncharacterized protein n=1 Tax=Streptomyces azureus TaxID=146537 RepID=A0A0K8PU59_STRAJ|nr:uncharacterized protein SAZU_5844 [Streptomyces azureus]
MEADVHEHQGVRRRRFPEVGQALLMGEEGHVVVVPECRCHHRPRHTRRRRYVDAGAQRARHGQDLRPAVRRRARLRAVAQLPDRRLDPSPGLGGDRALAAQRVRQRCWGRPRPAKELAVCSALASPASRYDQRAQDMPPVFGVVAVAA